MVALVSLVHAVASRSPAPAGGGSQDRHRECHSRRNNVADPMPTALICYAGARRATRQRFYLLSETGHEAAPESESRSDMEAPFGSTPPAPITVPGRTGCLPRGVTGGQGRGEPAESILRVIEDLRLLP